MSKVLITGGAGFIGSHLAKSLVNDGHEVVVIDNLSMGEEKNLSGLNVEFLEHDVTDKEFMHRILRKYKFDYIYFLAAVASVADSIARPLETHAVNQEIVLDTLEFIRHNNLLLKRFIFTSSAAVYGDSPITPKREDTSVQPLTPYAVDKYASERFTINYEKLHGVPTVAVRFFNVFGPNQSPKSPYSGVLSIITDKLKNGETFTLYGDGMQTRDFIYIDDVIEALRLVAIKTSKSAVYNVANGKETSLLDIIRLYEKVTGKKLKIDQQPTRNGDISKSVADITKIQKLGFKSNWSLEEGLKKYWQHETKKGA